MPVTNGLRVVDCELYYKATHYWKLIGEDTYGYIYWCNKCGSLGANDARVGSDGKFIVKVTDRIDGLKK